MAQTFYIPAIDSDRGIRTVTAPDGVISTTSVTAVVIDKVADAVVSTSSGTLTQSAVDSTKWFFDLAAITGINLETVEFAQLEIIYTILLSTGSSFQRSEEIFVNGAGLRGLAGENVDFNRNLHSQSSIREQLSIQIEQTRSQGQARFFVYVDIVNGSALNDGLSPATAVLTVAQAQAVQGGQEHTAIVLIGDGGGQQTLSENIVLSTRYTYLRGMAYDVTIVGALNTQPTIQVTAIGCEVEGFRLQTLGAGSPTALHVLANNFRGRNLRIESPRGHGIHIGSADMCDFEGFIFIDGAGSAGVNFYSVFLEGSERASVRNFSILRSQNDAIRIESMAENNSLLDGSIRNSGGFGININGANNIDTLIARVDMGANASGELADTGTRTLDLRNGPDTYQNKVTFDALTGIGNPGVAAPVGTPRFPSNVVADVATLAAQLRVRRIELRGTFAMSQAWAAYEFYGLSIPDSDIVVLAGQDVTNCTFTRLCVQGLGVGNYSVINGALAAVTGGQWQAFASTIVNSVAWSVAGRNQMVNCEAQAKDDSGVDVDCGGFDANVHGFSGKINLQNVSSPGQTVVLDFQSGAIVVEASCTAGTVIVRGLTDEEVTDNSAGSTVIILSERADASLLETEAAAAARETTNTAEHAASLFAVAGVQSDTDDIQTRLPAALVGGRMNSDVGAMQAGTVSASVVGTDAITADSLAADAIAEIQSGLATDASVSLMETEASAATRESTNTAEHAVTLASVVLAETEASAVAKLSINVAEHAATQAAVAAIPSAPTAIAVADAVLIRTAYIRRDNMAYNAGGFLLSARERVFPSKALADVATIGGTGEGETDTYTIAAAPDGTFPANPATFDKIRDV